VKKHFNFHDENKPKYCEERFRENPIAEIIHTQHYMRENLILRNIKRNVCHKYTNCEPPALPVAYFNNIN
jgi:hypothetical protein